MMLDPGDRKYVAWPVRGLPAAAPLVMVSFDGGAWLACEDVLEGAEKAACRILVRGPDADASSGVLLGLGVHTVRLKLTDYPEIDEVQNAGTIEVAPILAVVTETFGVTVEEVAAMAPHISVSNVPALPGDDVFHGSDQKVRVADVERWIAYVAAAVDFRLASRSKLPAITMGLVDSAAHAVVVNGAAAYLVSAAFPMKAGINDGTSYSAELELRYRTGLEELYGRLNSWLEEISVGGGTSGQISGCFPPTRIPDTMMW